MAESQEINSIIQEFRNYLNTEEGQNRLRYLKEKEPKETREVLEKLKAIPRGSPIFIDLVLYGLLPNFKTKYSKRVSIAPSFLNIKKFFGKFNYTENDWKELSILVFDLVTEFESNPSNLENSIRKFVSNKLSKALQCGSLSPIFFALNQNYPIINNREIRTYRTLSSIVQGNLDKLNLKLDGYLLNVDKMSKFAKVLNEVYGFKEISDMAVLDLFCYWYDENKREREDTFKTKTASIKEEFHPLDDKYITKFLQALTCSPPIPFYVGTLQKLNSEDKIIYNTEYQRGEVWDTDRKQKLIDSILRGYSINTILLRQLSEGKYECLDGQQRLKTLINDGVEKGFLFDGFPINPELTPEFNKKTYFSQLPDALKNQIRNFIIYAIIIYSNDDEETCKIFLRLQEGLPLNSAEKLNAMNGFLRNEIVTLSNHPFIRNLGITDNRFEHRYITAQAYLLTLRDQIIDVKYKNLQEIYNTYKNTRPLQTVTDRENITLNFLDKEFEQDAKIIRDNADFISLYLLSKYIIENYVPSEEANLKAFFINFMTKVNEAESSEIEENAPYYDYKTYGKIADSRNSIERRFNIILSKFLEFYPTIKPKDPTRKYNYWEKLAVYWKDKGICQLCQKKTTFEGGTVNHKIPTSKGGLTTIENGQWSCILIHGSS